MSKLDELLNALAEHGSDIPSGHLYQIDNARAELAALRQRAEDAVKVIAAEHQAVWINFNTTAAQKAAEDLLKRIEEAVRHG